MSTKAAVRFSTISDVMALLETRIYEVIVALHSGGVGRDGRGSSW
jgi:hypothetical protein